MLPESHSFQCIHGRIGTQWPCVCACFVILFNVTNAVAVMHDADIWVTVILVRSFHFHFFLFISSYNYRCYFILFRSLVRIKCFKKFLILCLLFLFMNLFPSLHLSIFLSFFFFILLLTAFSSKCISRSILLFPAGIKIICTHFFFTWCRDSFSISAVEKWSLFYQNAGQRLRTTCKNTWHFYEQPI